MSISQTIAWKESNSNFGSGTRITWALSSGGSLYAMCDPFFMLILMTEALGDEYIVWDKAAQILFKQPGKSKVRACVTSHSGRSHRHDS